MNSRSCDHAPLVACHAVTVILKVFIFALEYDVILSIMTNGYRSPIYLGFHVVGKDCIIMLPRLKTHTEFSHGGDQNSMLFFFLHTPHAKGILAVVNPAFVSRLIMTLREYSGTLP
jgi:hypothetical protein